MEPQPSTPMGHGTKSRSVNVRLEEGEYQELRRHAQRHERRMSAEIRLAIRLWLLKAQQK